VNPVFIRQVPEKSPDKVRYLILFADAVGTKFYPFHEPPKDLPALETLVHAHGDRSLLLR
jgi:hypothetical protein